MPSKLSAVIIAGHDHRPLKTPKQMLAFGETTVLNRTLEAYLGAGFAEVILVLSEHADEVKESLGPLRTKVKVETLSDPRTGGIGSQLKLGVSALSSSSKGFAIGLSDQPLLGPELLADLIERFSSSEKKILVPVCQGAIGHPAFFDAELASAVSKLPPTGEIWDVLKVRGDEVDDYHVYETAVVRNIEDVEDYRHLLEMAGLPVPEPAAKSEAGNGETVGDQGLGGEPEGFLDASNLGE